MRRTPCRSAAGVPPSRRPDSIPCPCGTAVCCNGWLGGATLTTRSFMHQLRYGRGANRYRMIVINAAPHIPASTSRGSKTYPGSQSCMSSTSSIIAAPQKKAVSGPHRRATVSTNAAKAVTVTPAMKLGATPSIQWPSRPIAAAQGRTTLVDATHDTQPIRHTTNSSCRFGSSALHCRLPVALAQ